MNKRLAEYLSRKFIMLHDDEFKSSVSIEEVAKAIGDFKANEARKAKDQAMRDLGLTKVRGPVSGRTYYE